MIRTAFWFIAWMQTFVLITWVPEGNLPGLVSAFVLCAVCGLYAITSFFRMSRSPNGD